MKRERILVTNSMVSCFQECRKKYEYRYIRGLVPVEKKPALAFGSVIHKGLESVFKSIRYYQRTRHETETYSTNLNVDFIRCCAEQVVKSESELEGLSAEDSCKALALLQWYITLYTEEDATETIEDVIFVEEEFRAALRNINGRKSRLLDVCGKVDGVVRLKSDGKLYILEHKTASIVDEGYLDRVEIDWQIALYAMEMSRILEEPVVGAIYDILIKPGIRMKQGETDEEFEARKAQSKTGKIKRKEAETEYEFECRLEETINELNFVRKIVLFEKDRMKEFMEEFWSVTKDITQCNCFYKNTGSCNKYGVCPYMKLCINNGSTEGLEDVYETRRAHEELSIGTTEQKEV